jgi:phenylacetate-CoA ligase
VIKSYLMDLGRLHRSTNEDLRKFQNKSIKKMVNYAYYVPLYREKYKKLGIHPSQIKSVDDIEKLPFIYKDDIRKYSPNGIIPPFFNKKLGIISRTGGTTGVQLPIYFDMYTVIKGMLGLVRALNEYGVDWRKSRMSLFLDLTDRSFENGYFIGSIFPALKFLFSHKNIQIFDLFGITPEVINKVDKFQPEFIAGYPYAIYQITQYKNKGFLKNIRPKCIMSSGTYLDSNFRKNAERVFDTKVYDFYAATESGPIAFECKNGNYHVHSDLIYPEFIKNEERIKPGEPGTLILTKLYGRGTPLIRYNGIDDVVSVIEKDCGCGLAGVIIKKIHGRKSESILLPGGKMALPSALETLLGKTVKEAKSTKIQRIQIIQKKIDNFEIKILFDKELRDVGTIPKKVFSILKKNLINKFGKELNVSVYEVDKFNPDDPYFISKIDRSKFIEKTYLV